MLPVFLLVAAVFTLAERLFPARPQPLFRRGYLVDALYVVIHIMLRIAFTSTLATLFVRASAGLVPGPCLSVLKEYPVPVQALALIVLLDLIFYVNHRLKHRWTWWWRLHETHHSSEELDWFSTVRFHPLEKVLDRTLYLFPLAFLGASDQALFILACVDSVIGSFSHANLRLRLGPLKYVLMGPEMHRWHHVRDPEKSQVNFGNNLSIFDWIFSTAYVTAQEPQDFGLPETGYPHESVIGQFFFSFRGAGPGEARTITSRW